MVRSVTLSTGSSYDLVAFFYLGVPRILEDTLPPHLSSNGDPDWEPFEEYMQTTRVNVNVRQVFPKGFDLSVAKP